MKNSVIIKHKTYSNDEGERSFELYLNGKHVDGVRAYSISARYDDVTTVSITLLADHVKLLLEGNLHTSLTTKMKRKIFYWRNILLYGRNKEKTKTF